MTALICGSMAYDTIMVFDDCFRNHILPDKVHMLNVSFVVPKLRREFGGCAGNVAYSLKLLDGDGMPLATVGEDFQSYADWLDQQGISRRYIQVVTDTYTAQAYITSDLDDNQITAFHPGAMEFSAQVAVPADARISLGILSPDSPEGIKTHARQFAAAGIPFLFDPGQALIRFNGEELRALVGQANWLAVNDYENELLRERTGWSTEQMLEQGVEAIIVTRGSQGSAIYTQDEEITIPSARPEAVVDPTGCGDAYRAGLLYGLMQELDWPTIGRIASLCGAYKVECHGTQNHRFTVEEFRRRFQDNFAYRF